MPAILYIVYLPNDITASESIEIYIFPPILVFIPFRGPLIFFPNTVLGCGRLQGVLGGDHDAGSAS